MKQTLTYRQFSGGYVDVADPAELQPDQLYYARNMQVDKYGLLRSTGSLVLNSASSLNGLSIDDSGSTATPLFAMGSDNGGTLLFYCDYDNGKIDVYSYGSGSWATSEILVNAGATSMSARPCYYAADGVLRVAVEPYGTFDNRPRWYGYIKRTHFPSENSTSFADWYDTNTSLIPPTGGVYNDTISNPSAGVGFNVAISTTSDGGNWPEGTYEFAQTFLYDNIQESLIYEMTGTKTIEQDDSLDITIAATRDFAARLTGGRIYCRISGSDEAWALLADISFANGIRAQLGAEYNVWAANSTESNRATCTSIAENLETFEILNGYSPDVATNYIGGNRYAWRAATVVGRRAFVGNVTALNEDGNRVSMGDRVMYSSVGKYDTFPTTQWLDINVNDGDEVKALQSYADRLLIFKKRVLYVVNISSGSDRNWYLEATYENYGVNDTDKVVATNFGVAFTNEFGVFLFNGSEVQKLTKNFDEDTFVPDDWTALSGSNSTTLGYDPKSQLLVVLSARYYDSSIFSNRPPGFFLYHFPTQSWTTYDNGVDSWDYSNFINDWDGNLMIAEETGNTVDFYNWDNSPTAVSNTLVKFRDEHFNAPGVIKKVYDVKVRYKSNRNIAPLQYSLNGEESFSAVAGTFASTATYDLATVDMNKVECQSLQLAFDESTNVNWSVKEILIDYRPLPAKRVS